MGVSALILAGSGQVYAEKTGFVSRALSKLHLSSVLES